jgi:hypothetical protein
MALQNLSCALLPGLMPVTGIFSQWGYLKPEVYWTSPHMEELREIIYPEVSHISR